MDANMERDTVAYYEGEFDIHGAKCLSGLVRFARDRMAAIVSPEPTSSLKNYGYENKIPVISGIDDIPGGVKRLMLATIHNDASALPELVAFIRGCIKKGIHVYNGDHLFVRPLFDGAEKEYVHDLRETSRDLQLFTGELRDRVGQLRILTVGMDCNIGKMTVSLELEKFLTDEGVDARFVATGQIGMMIKGDGIPLDRTIVDFTSGLMEAHLVKHSNKVLIIEGQGSIYAPMYSGLSLAQVHGSVPQLLILCVDPSRKSPRYFPELNLPDIADAILQYEQLAATVMPTVKVMGISANTSRMNEKEALDYIGNLEERFGLPAIDPVRFGCKKFRPPIDDWKNRGSGPYS